MLPYMIAEDKAAFSTAFEYIVGDFASEDRLRCRKTAGVFDRNNLLYG